MANRSLEINLRSATDLKNVNIVSKMEVYAVVSISGGDDKSLQNVKTPPDRHGGSNPAWDFPVRFKVEAAALQQNRLTLDFKLVCYRALGDKDVGEVHVSVKELLDSPANGNAGGWRFISYQVTKPSGRPKGKLSFSYRFDGGSDSSATPSPAAKVFGKLVKVPRAMEMKYLTAAELDSTPAAKVNEQPAAAYQAVKLDSNSVYRPPEKFHDPVIGPGSKSVYPPPLKVHEEPEAVYPVLEFDSNSVYPPAAKVYEEPTASYPLESKPNLVYPPPNKVHGERPAMYPAAELYSITLHQSAATERYPQIPLNPAIWGAKGIGEQDAPPAGWHPPPYGYVYPPAEPFYVYPPAPGYMYPPLPPAPRKNKLGMELLAGN